MKFLKCPVIGRVRYTSIKYLVKKCEHEGITIEHYLEHYISRKAATLIRRGYSIEEIREMFPNSPKDPIPKEKLDIMLKYCRNDYNNNDRECIKENPEKYKRALKQYEDYRRQVNHNKLDRKV